MPRRAPLPLALLLVATAAAAMAAAPRPGLAQAAPDPAAVATPPDPVVATVNGEAIRRSELLREQATLPDQYRGLPLDAIFDPLVARMIDQRLLLAEARRRELEKDPAVQAAVARARDRALEEQLVERELAARTTPERLQQAYREMAAQPGFAREEVHARHVLLETEAEAREVLAELGRGAEFAKVATERSKDPSAKGNAGDLGWFSREAMVPEFADAAFTIPPGTFGKDPVKSQFGWHVILVEAKRAGAPTYEEKEAELRQQVGRDAVASLLGEVRETGKIERFNVDGSPKLN